MMLSRAVVTTLATMLLVVGLGAPADAYTVRTTGCPGRATVPAFTVRAAYYEHFASFAQRRVYRSPCFQGRQIVWVKYRMFTGYPGATNWRIESIGPGNNAPAAYYLDGASLIVPYWEGCYCNRDQVSVDVTIKWFDIYRNRLGTMYINYEHIGDYRCLVGGVGGCGVTSDPEMGAYIWFH